MILEESEVTARIESPLNLLNRLKKATTPRGTNIIPSLPPTAAEVIDDLESKLKFGTIKAKAASIMMDAMDELKSRLPEVQKPEQLAKIASEMGKVVAAESKEDKSDDNKPQFVIYAPQFNNENNYETIYVKE